MALTSSLHRGLRDLHHPLCQQQGWGAAAFEPRHFSWGAKIPLLLWNKRLPQVHLWRSGLGLSKLASHGTDIQCCSETAQKASNVGQAPCGP